MMTIRPMRVSDISDVIAWEEVIFGSTLGANMIEQELKENPFARYLIMTLRERIIGYIGLWSTPPTGQIINYFIIPEERGKGFGGQLLETALIIFHEEHVNVVSLEVRVSNQEALSLYEKYGFKAAQIRPNYYDNGEDARVLIKHISTPEEESQ